MSTPKNNRLVVVAQLSLQLARKYMQTYSCAKSRQTFTQPQLMACLILRAYLKTTYRGVVEILAASESLQETLGIRHLPHYSTLKRFADRAGTLEIVDAMLADLAKQFAEPSEAVAIDSTGLESTSASSYFQTRRGSQRKKFVKLSLSILCGTLMPVGLMVSWGPSNDKSEAFGLLMKTATVVKPAKLLADAGYDAEWVHGFCHNLWNTNSFIPPAIHRRDGGVNGEFRSQMTPENLQQNGYSKRWKIESFMSALKRTTGPALQARSTASLFREAALRVLAYAIRR